MKLKKKINPIPKFLLITLLHLQKETFSQLPECTPSKCTSCLLISEKKSCTSCINSIHQEENYCSPNPPTIENCISQSTKNPEICLKCSKNYMLTSGNKNCVKSEIENCIEGIDVDYQQYCKICQFFNPSDDLLSCSSQIKVKNCKYGQINEKNRKKLIFLQNVNSFKNNLNRVESISLEEIEGDINGRISQSDRIRGERSECASCRDGFSLYTDDLNQCQKECLEGCGICSGSERDKCVKCDSFRGYFEVDLEKEGGWVLCRKGISLFYFGVLSVGFFLSN